MSVESWAFNIGFTTAGSIPYDDHLPYRSEPRVNHLDQKIPIHSSFNLANYRRTHGIPRQSHCHSSALTVRKGGDSSSNTLCLGSALRGAVGKGEFGVEKASTGDETGARQGQVGAVFCVSSGKYGTSVSFAIEMFQNDVYISDDPWDSCTAPAGPSTSPAH
eukprot:1264377-Amorphochlora_amoeboformis.AAC.3